LDKCAKTVRAWIVIIRAGRHNDIVISLANYSMPSAFVYRVQLKSDTKSQLRD